MKKLCFRSSFILILFISVVSVFAQPAQPDFNRERTFDVQHYTIRTKFDHRTKTVFGETTVSLKPLGGNFKELRLDAVGLKFESIKFEGTEQALSFRTTDDQVIVTLDKSYTANDLIALRFKYTAKPKKGVYFVEERKRNQKIIADAQIWTQGEPEEARHWFPSYDFPDDKATTEQILTVQKGETAIANGELLETTDNADETITFHYKMNVPHSVYLVSFVIGKYVKVTDNYKNVPLGFYVYPGREEIVPKAYGKTKEMMRIFENLTGIDFPYNKYDQTMVANFNFGGMENITATTMADTEIFLAESDWGKPLVEDLVAHELAHSWFGNMVTCRNWAELWLNEGFATFMEAAYREKMYGREDYMRKITEDAAQYFAEDARVKKRRGLFNQQARPDDSIFDAITYQKGGAVLHTLRETVGDEVFWKAVNLYLNRHKFGNVETPDLQKAFEETYGQSLDWFFKQWVYGGRYPILSYKKSYNPKNGILKLTVTQTQPVDEVSPVPFTLPMDVEIATAKGVKNERILINKKSQTFSIKLRGKPLEIVFDKDLKIPLKQIMDK